MESQFHFQTLPSQNPVEIPVSDCDQILRDASFPKVVSPEVQDQGLRFLSARIPFDLLSSFTTIIHPEHGTTLRAVTKNDGNNKENGPEK
nr:hypothetical protein [uncultured Desulfobacter sp.]